MSESNLNNSPNVQSVDDRAESIAPESADADVPMEDVLESEKQEVEQEMQEDTQDAVADGGEEAPQAADAEKKRKRDPAAALVRPPGKSLLPHSRVQKVLKADAELIMVQREASYLIALATEDFTKRFAASVYAQTSREGRATMQHKDVAALVRRASEYVFLDEVINWTEPKPAKKTMAKRPARTEEDASRGPTMLDKFMNVSKKPRTDDEQDDVPAMLATENEDGTLTGDFVPEQ